MRPASKIKKTFISHFSPVCLLCFEAENFLICIKTTAEFSQNFSSVNYFVMCLLTRFTATQPANRRRKMLGNYQHGEFRSLLTKQSRHKVALNEFLSSLNGSETSQLRSIIADNDAAVLPDRRFRFTICYKIVHDMRFTCRQVLLLYF